MMKRKTAVIFGIIIAAQLCLTPYAGVKVQAAELEEGQMFEDSSEDSETFGDVSIPDTQSAEKTEENEFGDDDGFSDGDVETFSAEDADQFRENMQELVLNVQDGEDITVKLNTLLAQARDKATDEKQCKVIVPPGNYTLTGTLHMYSNIYLYAEGATITKTSPRKEILLRLGDTKKSAGGYEGYRNITIDGGIWDSNYECVEDKGGPGGFVGFRIGHATNVTVKNVTFLNNLKSHFLELAGVKNAEITGCTFRGYWKEFTGGGQECIQLDACMPRIFPGYLPYDGSVCENIVIKDNTFEDVFAGIGSHSMMFDKPYKNITISNNRFNNLKKRAIWCLNYQDTVVTGNTMTNVGGGVYVRSVYTRNAHTVSGQEVSPEGNQYAENILIADNQITVLEPTVIDGKQWNGYGIWITGEVSLGSEEKLFLLKMMILRIQQIRRPMEFRREDILFAELQPEIIRSAEIATELNFPLQKTVHAGGTQSDFLIVIPTTIWGSVLPREAISEFPITIFPAETDMGFMQSEQRLHRKSAGFTEIQSPDL